MKQYLIAIDGRDLEFEDIVRDELPSAIEDWADMVMGSHFGEPNLEDPEFFDLNFIREVKPLTKSNKSEMLKELERAMDWVKAREKETEEEVDVETIVDMIESTDLDDQDRMRLMSVLVRKAE